MQHKQVCTRVQGLYMCSNRPPLTLLVHAADAGPGPDGGVEEELVDDPAPGGVLVQVVVVLGSNLAQLRRREQVRGGPVGRERVWAGVVRVLAGVAVPR